MGRDRGTPAGSGLRVGRFSHAKTLTIAIRNTRHEDFAGIAELCLAVYPSSPVWTVAQLTSHLAVFPEGQFVAVNEEEPDPAKRIVGMSSSLIVWWDDYSMDTSWRDFTVSGTFVNHDPEHGRTLYAAEVMVHPRSQGQGIGKQLYAARRALVERRGLLRIRAGARLSGFRHYASTLSPEQYTMRVVRGEINDPTLTFQLKEGFHVLGVARDYLRHDPESLGHAAVIEWINAKVATPADYAGRDPRFVAPAGAGRSTSASE